MLVFAPALLLSLLAMMSSVAGGVVRGVARNVLGADAGSSAKRAEDANVEAPQTTAGPIPTPVPGALFAEEVHQELGW